MMNENPSLSVVICTKNRADQLKACLLSLNNIVTNSVWDVLVVNNNSTDHTKQVIQEFKNISRYKLRSVDEEIQGTGIAKNTGWRLAGGEYITFIDDDCYPQADFIDSVLNVFHEDESLGFVGGRVLLFDPTDLPLTIQTCMERIFFNSSAYLATGVIHGANLTIKTFALQGVGGFDPMFGAGTKYPCEDVDIMAEILRSGWNGVYDPRVVVFHHHKRKLQSDANTLNEGYDRGRGAYFAKRLLRPGARAIYLYAWMRKIWQQSLSVTQREVLSALLFWLEVLVGKIKK